MKNQSIRVDEAAVQFHAAYLQNRLNLDANESTFFARQLEFIKSGLFDVKYAETEATKLFPVSSNVPLGAKTITYRQFDKKGKAKILASQGHDFPRVSLSGKEFTSKIVTLGSSYEYTLNDLRSAQFAGFDSINRLAVVCRGAVNQLIDDLVFFGDAEFNVSGVLNNGTIPVTTIINDGTGSTTEWANKTPTQIFRDLNQIINEVVENTLKVEKPNRLIMPVAQYHLISQTPMDTASGAATILEYFIRNNPYITSRDAVMPVNQLAGAGAGSTDVALAYNASLENISVEIPNPFETLPLQNDGWEFEQKCIADCGGVIIYFPKSMNKAEGI